MGYKMETKRLCIYFFYDKNGVVDEYVNYQIEALRKYFSWIHFVVNGKLSKESKEKIQLLVDEIYERDNKGNDIGAYKAAIDHIGWDEIKKYDEMVVMNFTIFGPVYPLDEVFGWAEEGKYDFWGLTWDTKTDWLGTTDYLHYNSNPYHIQSYFICFRKPLLNSNLLEQFYSEIPEECTYAQSGCFYEYAFPGYFEEYGYKGGVYCDDIDRNYPLLHNPAYLIEKYKMPFFKKRSFYHHYTDVLDNTAGEATKCLIECIESKTEYSMDLVWDSVLRSCNLSDIVRCAQLNRVLPKNIDASEKKDSDVKVGLVFHAYYEDLFDENILYVSNFPEETGILFTTNTDEKKSLLEKKLGEINRKGTVIVIENRGRDVSSLLVGAAEFVKKYDLICFSHDKKSEHVAPLSVGRSWAYKLNENLYPTREFVRNVINIFEKEARLGIAFPSYPDHGIYGQVIQSGWTANYDNTRDLLNDFDVHVKTDGRALCVAPLGTCFWFRPKALSKLYKGYDGDGWHYSDFPCEPNRNDWTILQAVEHSYAYFAQDAGYYPAFIYSDSWAAVEFTNLEFMRTSSVNMRNDMNRMVEEAIFGRAIDNNSEERNCSRDSSSNFVGIRDSLNLLSNAIKVRHYGLWKLLAPARLIGHMYFQHKFNK